jgi:hypothetical protein
MESQSTAKINWPRVFGCETPAGIIVWIVLGSIVTALLGRDFSALPHNRVGATLSSAASNSIEQARWLSAAMRDRSVTLKSPMKPLNCVSEQAYVSTSYTVAVTFLRDVGNNCGIPKCGNLFPNSSYKFLSNVSKLCNYCIEQFQQFLGCLRPRAGWKDRADEKDRHPRHRLSPELPSYGRNADQ